MLLSERGLGGDDPDLAHRLERFAADNSSGRAMRGASPQARARALLPRARGESGRRPLSVAPLIALAFPDRIAKARANGRLHDGEWPRGLAAARHPLARETFLAVAEIAGRAARRAFSPRRR